MPVQWQNVEIQLGGVDQYTDSPWLVPGSLEIAENVRFRAPPTISSKPPFESISNNTVAGTDIDAPLSMVANGREVLLTSQKRLYAFAPNAGLGRWAERGTLSDYDFERFPLHFDQSRSLANAQVATVGRCLVAAWGGPAKAVHGVVVDMDSNSVVSTISFTGTVKEGCCRPVAVGERIVLLLSDDANSSVIYYDVLDLPAGTWAFNSSYTALTLSIDPDGDGTFDADTLVNGTDQLALIYKSNAADGNHPTMVRCSLSGGVLSEDVFNQSSDVADDVVAIAGDALGAVYAAWNTTSPSSSGAVLNPSTFAAINGFTIDGSTAVERMGILTVDNQNAYVIYQMPEALPVRSYTQWRVIEPDGTTSIASSLVDWEPASKPFTGANSVYAWVMYRSDTQPTNALIEISDDSLAQQDARWLGTALRGAAARDDTIKMLPKVPRDQDDFGFQTVLPERFRAQYVGLNDTTVLKGDSGIVRISITLGNDLSCPWGPGRFFAGGRPSIYDGQACAEHGFSTYPERFEYDPAGSGVGYLETGDYSVVLVYEYLDASGRIMRSVPSAPTPLTGIAGAKLSFVMEETLLHQHGELTGFGGVYSGVRVVPYRTTVNPAETPFVYYRDSTHGFDPISGTDVEVGREFDEALLIEQELLYTDSDILDNVGTPACRFCWNHNGRIWLGGTERPNLAWFSQPYVETEQPRFNEALTLDIGDRITAYASMDEQLLCFGESAIYVIVGDGPPATGGLDLGFQVATVSTDVGCVNQRSVVVTPTGVMFQSLKGIYHINRKLEVVWMGQPVKTAVESYPTCVGAALLRETTEVVFGMSNDEASVRLIYNYSENKWSIDTPSVVMTGLCCARRDDSWRLWFSTSPESLVFAQMADGTEGDYEIAAIPKLRTAPIKLNTLQGWQRVRNVMLYGRPMPPEELGSHGLSISVDYDGEGTFAEVHTWTASEIANLSRYQFRAGLGRQKAQSVQFEVTLLPAGSETELELGVGLGAEFISLVCEGGFLPTTYKRIDPQTASK